jgi:hypothetical protein
MPDEKRDPPGPSPAGGLPVSLDQGALERVLARAAELQMGGVDTSSAMSEAQVIDLAGEVGIDAEHMRQAIAEERTRVAVPQERGFLGEWFGGTVATASRVICGNPTALLTQVDQWMQREESLRTKRRYADRLTWEARRDLVGSLQQGFNFLGRAYALTAADEVGASAMAVDADRTVVRLDALLTHSRRRSVGWSGVTAGLGVAGSAGLLELATLMPGGSVLVAGVSGAVLTAVGAFAAVAIARAHRRRLERAQLALEQVLDRLEHGDGRRSTNPIGTLIDAVARTVDGRR